MTLAMVFCGFVPVYANCPTADLTGDCVVNFEDLAVFAGQWLTGDGIPADMTFISGGTFIMGDTLDEGYSDEKPVHLVSLGDFYVGKNPVTNGQYAAFLTSAINSEAIYIRDDKVYGSDNDQLYCDTSNSSPYSQLYLFVLLDPSPPHNIISRNFLVKRKLGRSMADDPMIMVTWYGAAAYCNWRSEQEGREPCYDLSTGQFDFNRNGYRLPTEAQWEYAARGGGTDSRFPWGDTINHDHANYTAANNYGYDNSPHTIYTCHLTWAGDEVFPYTSPVGTFPSNGYALYDMVGNVQQWCHDWYGPYSSDSQTNPTGPATGKHHVVRGGGWNSLPDRCRITSRGCVKPVDNYNHVGFRIVCPEL